MTTAQTEENELEDNGLEEEIYPDDVEEGGDVKNGNAQVESERLTSWHQWMAAATEILAKGGWDVGGGAVGCRRDRGDGKKEGEHVLAARGHVLLT